MAFTFGAATPATNNNTFGGFGTSQATSTPAFGQAAPTFGNASTTTTPFGSTTTNNATGFGASTSSAGFGFGGASTAPATSNTGFSFGNTSTAPATSTTGFSFGNTSAAPTTNTATGGFGFGATSTAPTTSTTGFSFGATSTAPATSTSNTGFSFGSTSSAPTTTSTFGGFGSNTFGGGFGANKTNTFGTNSNTLSFGQNTNQQQKAQQVYQLLAQIDQEERAKLAPSIYSDEYKPDNVWQALALLKSWWDPKSPHCRFRHYFYNLVEPQQVQLYQKPADHDQAAWDAAQAANPDPTKMVPALAIGFDDVQKRMDEQHKMSEAHLNKLNQIQTLLKEIQKKSQLETAVKLNEYKRRHMQTVQRVIKFLKYAQVLRNKGLSITPDEEVMRSRLESLQEQLQRSEQFHGKLSQLWAQLQLIKESGRKYGKIDGVDEWDAVSEENMAGITKILEEQNNGVQHIIDVLEADSVEIENMHKAWKGLHNNY